MSRYFLLGADGKLGPIWARYLLENNNSAFLIGTFYLTKDLPSDLKAIQDDFPNQTNFFYLDVLSSNLEKELIRIWNPTYNKILINVGVDNPPKLDKDNDLKTYSIKDFSNTIAVNLVSTSEVLKVICYELSSSNISGRIVLLGSMYAGISPDQKNYISKDSNFIFHKPPAYGSSKAGLNSLSKYFATMFGENDITINVISPGVILGEQDSHFIKTMSDRIPLRRVAEAKNDIAPVIEFLLSEKSKYITGQEILVDGGYTIW